MELFFFFLKAFCGRLSSGWIRYRKAAGGLLIESQLNCWVLQGRLLGLPSLLSSDGYSVGCRAQRSVQQWFQGGAEKFLLE